MLEVNELTECIIIITPPPVSNSSWGRSQNWRSYVTKVAHITVTSSSWFAWDVMDLTLKVLNSILQSGAN